VRHAAAPILLDVVPLGDDEPNLLAIANSRELQNLLFDHGFAGIAFPTPEVSAPPLPFGAGGDDSVAQARGEDADLAGLRDYQRGDPPQRVAWKAVARGAGWYSKAFEGSGGGPVMLDWRALPPELDVEARLSRLSAWVLGAERAARPFALSLPGFTLPASQGREHRRLALTALALFPSPDRR